MKSIRKALLLSLCLALALCLTSCHVNSDPWPTSVEVGTPQTQGDEADTPAQTDQPMQVVEPTQEPGGSEEPGING